MRGRKPKPTALKIVTGNPGRRPLPKCEPQPRGDLSDPPDWLSEAQKEYWRYAVEHAPRNLLKQIDGSVLTIFVVAQDFHEQAARKVAALGVLVRTANSDIPIQSPYVAILNRQAVIMMRASEQLGFTPVSRPRIISGDEPPATDKWSKV